MSHVTVPVCMLPPHSHKEGSGNDHVPEARRLEITCVQGMTIQNTKPQGAGSLSPQPCDRPGCAGYSGLPWPTSLIPGHLFLLDELPNARDTQRLTTQCSLTAPCLAQVTNQGKRALDLESDNLQRSSV